ncbi:MAG TPA: hypothetical protein VK730_02100 [Solirubrobacteraceae bacterium]|jgi:hypothetical protein|nr:hypothetical protein [Solirubrobacteraceae bacterium]
MAKDGDAERMRWNINASTAAAWFSAVVAAGGITLAVTQNRVASRQNALADRQSLVTLVSELTRNISLEQKAETSHLTGEQVLIEQALLADAEQALTVAEALHESVPAIDSFEIGKAFSYSVEYSRALTSLNRAAEADSAPRTRANALREEARLLFLIGGRRNLAKGREDLALAYRAFEKQPDVTRELIDHDHAFTDFYSAAEEAHFDCQRAHAEFLEGKALIRADHAILNGAMEGIMGHGERSVARCSKPERPLPPEVRMNHADGGIHKRA